MTLNVLMKQSNQISGAIRIADAALNNHELICLMSQRDALNLAASHLKPRSSAQIVFLCDLIKEYADFIADGPASLRNRAEALDAIARMTTALKT